jgi:hypothetical protein
LADPEKDAQQERGLRLFFERWLEQVKTPFVPRRARTLAALSALLLWSGIERTTAGARGFKSTLKAARDLVSHAVVLGKLRRDIGDLAACVEHHVGKGPQGQYQAFLRLLKAGDPSTLRAETLLRPSHAVS